MQYRFLWLNDRHKEIQTLGLEFSDDVSALEFAAELCRDYAIDIYESGRRVAHLKRGNAELDATDKTSL